MEKAELFDEDKVLFDSMVGNYQSENERKFFEVQRHKQEYQPVGTQDVLLLEDMNKDGIYLIREGFGEYFIGSNLPTSRQVHTMTLSKALNTNLKDAGILNEDITLFEWLRRRDYKNVRYDYNLDKE